MCRRYGLWSGLDVGLCAFHREVSDHSGCRIYPVAVHPLVLQQVRRWAFVIVPDPGDDQRAEVVGGDFGLLRPPYSLRLYQHTPDVPGYCRSVADALQVCDAVGRTPRPGSPKPERKWGVFGESRRRPRVARLRMKMALMSEVLSASAVLGERWEDCVEQLLPRLRGLEARLPSACEPRVPAVTVWRIHVPQTF